MKNITIKEYKDWCEGWRSHRSTDEATAKLAELIGDSTEDVYLVAVDVGVAGADIDAFVNVIADAVVRMLPRCRPGERPYTVAFGPLYELPNGPMATLFAVVSVFELRREMAEILVDLRYGLGAEWPTTPKPYYMHWRGKVIACPVCKSKEFSDIQTGNDEIAGTCKECGARVIISNPDVPDES
jgi:hypothetical protein